MSDFCQYVDVFYGNGETDRFFEDGLASKWFYIKALCGNTTPHATLPFGKMSVGAYSGGYPSGYGTHYPNSCGGIKKLYDEMRVRGFSHLHQSGTGAMKYYYNYAVTTPFYGETTAVTEYRPIQNENAVPGYYSVLLDDILCELTVDGGVAVHRYTFDRNGGRVAIDFSNDGLAKVIGEKHSKRVKDPRIEITPDGLTLFSGTFSGIQLYFCAKTDTPVSGVSAFSGAVEGSDAFSPSPDGPFGVVYDFSERTVVLRVGYSTVSFDAARREVLGSTADFDEIKATAYAIWNEHLSKIKLETADEELKGKFYSNLYHSLIKPCDMRGESILGVEGEVVSDIATFWDQYKTVLPLIYACYPNMADAVVRGVINISETMQKIPCSFGLTDLFPCEEQAKMLGILTLCDAYYMGIGSATKDAIERCMKRELLREDYASFLKTGYFERYTHILDVTDACLSVADITTDPELKKKLFDLSKNWEKAYGEDGLMSNESPYYEGDRYTYSFRIQKNMEERVRLAGGKERFGALLDNFFGFGGESVKQLTYIGALEEISRTHYHRFEGFNNECDMETPYAYIYADRHDRLCEILHECVSRSFGTGRGALPGNNDSGGLSSMLVWNVLGVFPISGRGEFLIGAPQMDGAEITLSNGKVLEIRVSREKKEQILVDRVTFNGVALSDYALKVQDFMCGGVLQFFMK